MQNRSFLLSLIVGALIVAGCSKISTKNITGPNSGTPTTPSQEGAPAPETPQSPAAPGTPAAPAPTVSTPSAPAPVVTAPSAPAVEYEQNTAPSKDLESKEERRKAEADFNAQLDQAQVEAASNPDTARSSLLTAERAAKMKAVRAKRLREAEQE